ncbi:MAG: amidohydrolase family protein, partial [Bdellovibrio sp.]
QIISEFLNDHLLECIHAFPERYLGLGNLPMQDPDLAIREAQRIQRVGRGGVQIGSNIHGLNLSDSRFHPVWAELEALDLCVFVHPWNMMGEERMGRYWLPWLVGMPAESALAICSLIFGGIFEKFPRLRFAFAHGGGSFPWTLGRIAHGFDSRPDLVALDNSHPPQKYLGRFFVDSLVHDPKALKFLVDQMSEDCILLGSDYPFPLGENPPGKLVESLDFAREIKQKIYYHNAIRFLFGERKPWTSS